MAAFEYADFDLEITRIAEGKYRAQVIDSPAGQASIEFTRPFSEMELENFILKIGRTRTGIRHINSPEMRAAESFGKKLYDTVFRDEVRECLTSSLHQVDREDVLGLRIKLRLVDVPELADLPWEYLYHPDLRRFIVLSAETPITRYVNLPRPVTPLKITGPLHLLVMVASPSDYQPLDVNREKTKLKNALYDLEQRGLVKIEWLEKGTLSALQQRLRKGPVHLFHFIGHGGWDEQVQNGVLLFENEQGQGYRVNASRLATILHDHKSLRLIVLNACEGARMAPTDPFASVATTLIQQGIPAVLAMQFEITDRAAIQLAQVFYESLADGYPAEAALSEARKAIFASSNDVEWGTPVLYLRAPDGKLFDLATASLGEENERIAKEQAEQPRLAREKAETDRLAKEKAEAESITREKAEQERLAREKAEADRLARQKAKAEHVAKIKPVQPNRILDFWQRLRSAPGLALLGVVLVVVFAGLVMNWMGLFNGGKPGVLTATHTPTLAITHQGFTNTQPAFKDTQPTATAPSGALSSGSQTQPSSTPTHITTITAAPLVAVTVKPTVKAEGSLSPTVNLVSQMWGASNAIVIQDNIAYLGEGPRLTILDVSDPTHPIRVAQTPLLYDVIQKIAVSQTTVYAVLGNNRISIIDVASPQNPKVLGSYDDPANNIGDIAVAGNLAFVLDSGLRIIDVSNPAKLAEVGFFDVGGAIAETAVSIKGQYAYLISNNGGGLYVVDISDPGHPRQVGFVGFGPNESGTAIELIDNRAYVSGSNFWTIDISKPTSPTIVTSVRSTYARALQVNGNFLYLLTDTLIQIFDIHHPTDPLLESSYSVHACDIVRSGSYVFVADCAGGMRDLDVSDATKPTEVGGYGLGALGKGTAASSGGSTGIALAVSGNYAYIASDCCFQVVDISDPFHPQTVGILKGIPRFTRQVAVAGNYAYVLTFVEGITVVDISDPKSPTFVKALALPKYTGSFVMGKGYLYEISTEIGSDSASGMRVIDISDPKNMALVGTIIFDEDVYYGGFGGQFAYVASHDKLYVVDVSNPANPTVVTSQNRSVSGLTIRGNYAYLLNSEGLNVLDISDTKDIWRVGLCPAQDCGYNSDIALISGNYVLIGSMAYGGDVTLADISDPANPFKIASLRQAIGNTGRTAGGAIALNENYIYKVSVDGGLFILSISK